MPLIALTSCAHAPFDFEKFAHEYSSLYDEALNKITNDDNYDWETADFTQVSTQAQAIQMYSWGDGWATWNGWLHKKGPEPLSEEELNIIEEGWVRPPEEPEIKGKFKVGSYILVEEALKQCRCFNVKTYSGSEYNQDDLYGQLEDIWFHNDPRFTFKDGDPVALRSVSPKSLIGKSIVNYGFMSTSIKEEHAREFLTGSYSGGFKNTILYVLNVDSNSNGLYISNEKKFARHPLSWWGEYQLLLNRKLTITITDAWWEDWTDPTEPNVLHIEANVHN